MTRRAATIVVALVVVALVGVGAAGRSGSPIHKKPTLGLDLQGGLEVTLQAVPPKDRAADRRPTSTARSRSCATASTGSASPSPRSARRAPTRSRSSSRASRIPAPRPRSSARRRSSSSSTSRRTSCRRRSTPAAKPVAKDSVYALLAGQQALAAKGTPEQCTLFDAEEEARRGPGRDQGGRAAQARRQGAEGVQAVRRPRRAPSSSRVRPTTSARATEGDVAHAAVVPDALRPAEGAGDDGRRPEAQRHPAGLRPAVEPADRDDGVHGRGREEVRRDHAAEAQRGKLLYNTLTRHRG